MKRFSFVLGLLSAVPCISPARGAEPAKIVPQSIECFYPAQEEQSKKTVLCTVRLHVSVAKGMQLWMQQEQDVSPAPLVGKDAEGHILVGTFREWEACFDSKGLCGIMAYDFHARPHGDWLAFDTELDVPVTQGVEKIVSSPFPVKEPAMFALAGHRFSIVPAADDSPRPALEVSYPAFPDIANISFQDARGTPLPCSIVEAAHNEAERRRSIVYSLAHQGEKACLCLCLYTLRKTVRIPVRFRVSIGTPLSGSLSGGKKKGKKDERQGSIPPRHEGAYQSLHTQAGQDA